LRAHKTELMSNGSLLEAVWNGDIGIVQRCLAQPGYPVNEEDSYGRTALHIAAGQNKVNIAYLLLNHDGFHVGKKDHSGRTALHATSEARTGGHVVIAALLLNHDGFPVSARENEKERTVLHFAARRGHVNIAALLLNYDGFPVDWKDTKGLSAIETAHKFGHGRIFDSLVALSNCVKLVYTVIANIPVNDGKNSTTYTVLDVLDIIVDLVFLNSVGRDEYDYLSENLDKFSTSKTLGAQFRKMGVKRMEACRDEMLATQEECENRNTHIFSLELFTSWWNARPETGKAKMDELSTNKRAIEAKLENSLLILAHQRFNIFARNTRPAQLEAVKSLESFEPEDIQAHLLNCNL